MNDAGEEAFHILRQVKPLAVRYYRLTGKPLGVSGELAEYEVAEKLALKLADARCPGFDAFREEAAATTRFQIKGRAVKPTEKYKGRVPNIKITSDFDAVLLVLLDQETLDLLEIWQAERAAVISRLAAPGSKARNERGSMGISQFKSIARRIWPECGPQHPGR